MSDYLPLSSYNEHLKNMKNYWEYGLITYYSEFEQSDDDEKQYLYRYAYKNNLEKNKEEIEEMCKKKFSTVMKNVRLLVKGDNSLVGAKNSDNGIIYTINYFKEPHGYYILIHRKILKYLLKHFDVNTLKVYVFLKYRCLKRKTKVTREEICEAIGLSTDSRNNLTTISDITVALNEKLIKKTYEYITEINEESGNEQVKRYCYYEIIKDIEVLKAIGETNGISKGERAIINYLDNENIDYIYDEPYFDDLLSQFGNPLRPDFIIEDRKLWIEFDGKQHYEYGYFNDDLLDLMNSKYRDKLKDEYANKNGWKLIRIPYWNLNKIEEILKDTL